MAETFSPELKKLMNIARDAAFSAGMRSQAIADIARLGSRQAFLALLDIAADKDIEADIRDQALVSARDILKNEK
ncbi:conserved hypothetical protein [Dehalogenimonas lykanthroporepellens BL-DC-9]|jgi:hypothetical protein|nr:conserved hypothetical protein [Dehalogenimonas lykanthroporepellens BL-DC-9]